MRAWIEHWKKLTLFEQGLTNMMIAWVVLFGSGIVIFWFYPEEIVRNMGGFASNFFDMSRFEELPAPAERFWSALALSLMVTLTFLSAIVAYDVRKYIHLTLPILVSKGASTFFFLYFYFADRKSFAYLGGAFLSDGPIFLGTLVVYLVALKQQRKVMNI
ncbi:MAG: hypothetical protein AB1405_15455 [Bdellovibrionota bacterium]